MISDMAAPPIRSPDRRDFLRPMIVGRGRAAGAAALWRSGSIPLQALHPLGQRPERAIEADILVNAVDGAGLRAADTAI